jgi:transposase
MVDELGIGDVRDQATHQTPALRDLTLGEAVKAMVLTGLGCINQALSLVPRFFQNTPTSRLLSPRVAPKQRNDDALGRALETLYASGVTERYSLVAATAAQRLGLSPRFAHLDRTSVHVDGRDNSDEEPAEHVMHSTRGDRRDQRPARNQVRLALMVEHQAGIPVLMKPLRGNRRDAHDLGQLRTDPMAQWQRTSGMTCLVADSALYSAENLQKLAETRTPWITRVPATLRAAQAVLAQAAPQTRAPLPEGYRYHGRRSSDGGVEPRWGRLHSAARQPQAQRPIDQQLLKRSEQAVTAFKHLCRTAFACTAEAQQALATFAQGLQAPFVPQRTVRPPPRSATRGRPGQGTPPAQVVSQLEGARAMRIASRQALSDHHRCVILATHARDDTLLPPQEV